LVFILFLVLLFPDGSCSRAAGNRWSGPSGRSLGALWSSAR
jgi:hypothetical protein